MRILRTMAIATAMALGITASAVAHDGRGYGHGQPARLVGVWQITVQPTNCQTGQPLPIPKFEAQIVFHAGGTSTEAAAALTPRTPGFGTWEFAQPGRYVASAVATSYDVNGFFAGTTVVRRTIVLGEDGDTFEAATRTVITDASGNAITRCAIGSGRRFE
jgi:hypothetical protein